MMESPEPPDQVKLGISKRLRQERERLGWTQSELADLIGVTRFTIAHYEAGRRMPTADQLHSMGVMGADTSFVLSGTPQLSSLAGRERFTRILVALREHCRLSKFKLPDDEIVAAAIFLAEGARPAHQVDQSELLTSLSSSALNSVFESLKSDHG